MESNINPCKIYFNQLENKIFLEGDITFSNVLKLRDIGIGIIAKLTEINIDLIGLKYTDSSALALLLALTRNAKVHKKEIKYYNLPNKMLELGRFNGLDVVLSVFKKPSGSYF